MDKINKKTYIIAGVSFLVLVAAIYFLFIFQKNPNQIKVKEDTTEVQSINDIELKDRPYVTLTPTSDGAELIISIENMGYFDNIEYELTYLADNPEKAGEKIARGAIGDGINTKDEKHKKSHLLGTASKGTKSPDRGITEGKLTMKLFRDGVEYLSETPWDFVLTGTAVTTLKDTAGNFQLDLPKFDKDYWVILMQTVGVPEKGRDFEVKNVALPVYGTFSIAPEFKTPTNVSIKLSSDVNSPALYVFSPVSEKWQKIESTFDSSQKTITAKASHFGTFVVVSGK